MKRSKAGEYIPLWPEGIWVFPIAGVLVDHRHGNGDQGPLWDGETAKLDGRFAHALEPRRRRDDAQWLVDYVVQVLHTLQGLVWNGTLGGGKTDSWHDLMSRVLSEYIVMYTPE